MASMAGLSGCSNFFIASNRFISVKILLLTAISLKDCDNSSENRSAAWVSSYSI